MSTAWQRSPDDERVDAALLLPAIRGALPAHDSRSLATLQAVEAELGRSGYVYRFRHDDRPLEDAEGAFVLCGFLMALAAHQQGWPTEAFGWFERNRAACGPPGLFTEEFDVRQRQPRGNPPKPSCTRSCSNLRSDWPARGTHHEHRPRAQEPDRRSASHRAGDQCEPPTARNEV